MRVARAFDRAEAYDQHAEVQRRVAVALAARVAALPLAPRTRILEVGCGTGLLGRELIGRLPHADWTMTDIAPAMIRRARRFFEGRDNVQLAVMDGEHPDRPGPYDLIVSNLALQWFVDLPAAIARLRGLLAPDGWLAFTTLAQGTFAEWREAHGGLPAATPVYPSPAQLTELGLAVSIRDECVNHASGRAFLQGLKALGAATPRPGHRPLRPGELRGVIERFEAIGAPARYVVATCIARRTA
jgi:malonyl-CoA O-methyltransferase